MVQSARIVLLSELVGTQQQHAPQLLAGDTVRTLGRLRDLDVHTNTARIELDGNELLADTELLGVFDYRIGAMYQWLGELVEADAAGRRPLRLRARILRAATDLDVKLFEQALVLRRRLVGK
ncbi:hypothetical protein HK105_209391 [Polyrhizophydium stewartii]|uniref:Uncharacterized protein n=1 Tax=Polyrhizophydium stewartii TaxID=2732419 RepID=A0ABR4MV49_9FUNG|nr:hypothetical protein HK105_002223 [Polyrhizophydium stewartii]